MKNSNSLINLKKNKIFRNSLFDLHQRKISLNRNVKEFSFEKKCKKKNINHKRIKTTCFNRINDQNKDYSNFYLTKNFNLFEKNKFHFVNERQSILREVNMEYN